MLPIKNNIGADRGGLAFRLTTPSHGMPMVEWEHGPVSVSADSMLGTAAKNGEAHGAKAEAAEWLRDVLVSGPQPASELKRRAEEDGIAVRTLERAKATLGVEAVREGYGEGGRWMWAMPHRPPVSYKERHADAKADNDNVGGQSTKPHSEWGEL